MREGDEVKTGQELMQIDPRNLQIQVDSQTQSLAASRSQLEETRRSIESAKAALAQAQANFERQQGLMKSGLTSREQFETAQHDLAMRQASVEQAEQSIKTQETRIKQQESLLQNAQYDLSKMRLTSPIDGVVTKRNVDVGEMVSGNEYQTVALLTVADMSVIRAEIEVDETDIPTVRDRPAGQGHDRRAARTRRSRARSPKSATARSSTAGLDDHARDQLQGRRDDRRQGAERPAWLHLHGGHHHGDAAEGDRPCRFRR